MTFYIRTFFNFECLNVLRPHSNWLEYIFSSSLLYGNIIHYINDNKVVTTMSVDKFLNRLCTFNMKFEHNLGIIKINECLVAKNLLTNVTKTNKHLNVTIFVHALV